MTKLTKRIVDAAEPGDRERFLWCSYTHGMGVRIYPSGTKIFIAQVRVGRRSRRFKIGQYGPFTVEQAREKAEQVIRAAAEGRDAQLEKRDARDALTVTQMCERYLEAADNGLVITRFRVPKRQSTLLIDKGRIQRHIIPLIGSRLAGDVMSSDVQKLADDITRKKTAGTFKGRARGKAVVKGGAGTAARVTSVLGGIYTWAIKRGHVACRNPVRGIETIKYQPRERVLSDPELSSLGQTIRGAPKGYEMAASAIYLMALTGLRKQEACGLRWDEIDETGACLRLQVSKTGRSVRPLGLCALQLLNSRPRTSRTWVFPSDNERQSADLKKKITELFKQSGLVDAKSHDLRRTFATAAANLEYSEATIMELLGHSARSITARHYIRRPDAVMRAAVNKISSLIDHLISGSPSAEVVLLTGSRA